MKPASFLNKMAASRLVRAGAGIFLFLGLATIDRPAPPPPPLGPRTAHLSVRAVPLDPGDAARRRLGPLVFRRGFALSSDDPRFGGISSMKVEGGQVLAISDTGMVFRFPLPVSAGTLPVHIAPLRAGPGSGAQKWDRDSESMAADRDHVWLGFEGENMIWRYRRADGSAEASVAPALMRRWRSNSGPESLVKLSDGRFLVIEEGPESAEPFSKAVLFSGDPTDPATRAAALRYRRVPGFRPTDAAELADGRLLILNRRFSWLTMLSAAFVLVDPRALQAGDTLEGPTIAMLTRPLTVDNMEALSVRQENGRTIIDVASDDNLMPIQRTLFLEFELDARQASRPAPPPPSE
jgi:hypothetical protein